MIVPILNTNNVNIDDFNKHRSLFISYLCELNIIPFVQERSLFIVQTIFYCFSPLQIHLNGFG